MRPIYSTWLADNYPADTGDIIAAYKPTPYYRSHIVLPDGYSVNSTVTSYDGERHFALYATGEHTPDREYDLIVVIPGHAGRPYNPTTGLGDIQKLVDGLATDCYRDLTDVIFLGIYGDIQDPNLPIGTGDYTGFDITVNINKGVKRFIRDIIGKIRSKYRINSISLHCLSNGSALANVMCAEFEMNISSIVLNSGSPVVGWVHTHNRPYNVLSLHGVDDGVVPIDGGYSPHEGLDVTFVSAEDEFETWCEHNENVATITYNETPELNNVLEKTRRDTRSVVRYLKVPDPYPTDIEVGAEYGTHGLPDLDNVICPDGAYNPPSQPLQECNTTVYPCFLQQYVFDFIMDNR